MKIESRSLYNGKPGESRGRKANGTTTSPRGGNVGRVAGEKLAGCRILDSVSARGRVAPPL